MPPRHARKVVAEERAWFSAIVTVAYFLPESPSGAEAGEMLTESSGSFTVMMYRTRLLNGSLTSQITAPNVSPSSAIESSRARNWKVKVRVALFQVVLPEFLQTSHPGRFCTDEQLSSDTADLLSLVVRLTVPVQLDGMPVTVKVLVSPSVMVVESMVCAAAPVANTASSGRHSSAGSRPRRRRRTAGRAPARARAADGSWQWEEEAGRRDAVRPSVRREDSGGEANR